MRLLERHLTLMIIQRILHKYSKILQIQNPDIWPSTKSRSRFSSKNAMNCLLDMVWTFEPVSEDSHIFSLRISPVLRFLIPIDFNPVLDERIIVFCIKIQKTNADLADWIGLIRHWLLKLSDLENPFSVLGISFWTLFRVMTFLVTVTFFKSSTLIDFPGFFAYDISDPPEALESATVLTTASEMCPSFPSSHYYYQWFPKCCDIYFATRAK